MRITADRLHLFCSYRQEPDYGTFARVVAKEGLEPLTIEEWSALRGLDLKVIVADFAMDEDRPDGDDILNYVTATVDVCREGYAVHVWYGPDTEALAVGYRAGELEIVNPESPEPGGD